MRFALTSAVFSAALAWAGALRAEPSGSNPPAVAAIPGDPAPATAVDTARAAPTGAAGLGDADDSAEGDVDDTEAAATRVSCLDDVSPDGNPRKGVQRRPFLKRRRVEVSAVGGLYASDVLSSTYTAGGALAFYPSEDFGLEALVMYAPVQFRLEEAYTGFDRENRFKSGSAFTALGSLLYAPFHAKFKFSESTIIPGDIFVSGGAGRMIHDSVQGLTWQAGVGLKLYLWNHLTFRLDLRDLITPQEVLGQGQITNNVNVLAGISLWLL